MTHVITFLLVIACPVLTVARGIPQLARLFRYAPEGVSVLTWQLWLVLAEPWIAYGIVYHVPAEVVTNCGTSVLALVTLVLVTRATGTMVRQLAFAGLLSVAVVALVLVSDHTRHIGIISVVAVTGSVTMYIPQAVRTFRTGSLSGVSLGTWSLALITAIMWGVYGVLIHKTAVWLPSIVTVPASAVIVVKLLMHRSPARPEAAPELEVEVLA